MKCQTCGDDMRPTMINDKGPEFLYFRCPHCYSRKVSEITRRLINVSAYQKYRITKPDMTWNEYMKTCLKEKNI